MAIRVLVVTDGDRFTFDPRSTTLEGVFSIETLIDAFRTSTVPSISVDTAHRRGATNGETHVTIPGDFVFTQLDLSAYDVIWLIGDEGYNEGSLVPHAGVLTDDENIKLAEFMDGGGGVFAVGDHDGLGAYLCGALPRVRTMRKWFEWDHVPAGFPANWSTGGVQGGTPQAIARADTLRPDSADGQFYFYGQSDPTPQPLTFPPGPVHEILQGPSGPIGSFPDHMHEGEAIELPAGSPFLTGSVTFHGATLGTKTFTEFPTVAPSGHREVPKVIAQGTEIPGHTTLLPPTTYVATDGKTIGLLSAYDGHNVGVGRILTASTFHHYLDINLRGDPTTDSTTPGVGPTNSEQGLPQDVLDGMTAYYQNAVVWLARAARSCYLWVEKSTFGVDEVNDAPSFADAFFIVLDGFTPAQVGATPTVAFGGPFAAIPGIQLNHTVPVPEFGGSPNLAQRILIPCSITFPLPLPPNVFPVSPNPPRELLLGVAVTFGAIAQDAEAVFELASGADPYFTNVGPGGNPAWLSEDLRVFTVTPGYNATPFAGVTLSAGSTTTLDPAAGYQYIQGVLNALNASYHDPTGTDPFVSVVPQQSGAFSGDSSVTSFSPNPGDPPHPFVNYNFAVARVRLQGAAGTSADHVKVFFRLFATQSNDTDYQPGTTYASTPDPGGLPGSPVLGPDDETFPFFATGNYPGTNDYVAGGANNQPITVDPGAHGKWAYFGCFLDVYDFGYLGDGQTVHSRLPGTHHCIVAQIAYDGAPIVNANGITLSPGNSDKLAQRNLQVTGSDNPGSAATHRVPQTFDLRPSATPANDAGELLDRVDELMIDWGNTPVGSRASIYWPAVETRDVLRIAAFAYPAHRLSASDEHTIACEVGTGPTFVPIPPGTGKNFAGLFTVDLPPTVVYGQEFHIVVRRGSTRRLQSAGFTAQAAPAQRAQAAVKEPRVSRNWRYGVGTFQITIPVQHADALLPVEENTLAVMKWRLGLMQPSNRWYPVLQRYVAYIGARVGGLGGNPGAIPGSPNGYRPPPGGHGHGHGGGHGHGHPHGHEHEHTGKVIGVCYDRFGDFEGFVLLTEAGHEHRFRARENEIERLVRAAWKRRYVISVRSEAGDADDPVSIVLRRAPPEDAG